MQYRFLVHLILLVAMLGGLRLTMGVAQAQESGEQIFLPLVNLASNTDSTVDPVSALGAAATCSRSTIHQGDSGDDVRHAQKQLLKVGDPNTSGTPAYYVQTTGGADGSFGSGTHNATIAYQRIVFPGQSSEHDGWIGSKTWAKLGCNSGDTPVGASSPTSTPKPPKRTPTRTPTPASTPRPPSPPSAGHNCSGNHWINTGTDIGARTRFQCRYVKGKVAIHYNVMSHAINNGKTDQSVVNDLATKLNEAYNKYHSGWRMRAPTTSSNGLITIAIGGYHIPANGYSRQDIIQFKPMENRGRSSSEKFGEEFVYHEMFHQFQWAYTDDDPLSYSGNRGFFESMADYAAKRALSPSSVCNSSCVNELSKANQKPWDPPYRGESFFYWGKQVMKPGLTEEKFFGSLLDTFDRTGNDIQAVRSVLGERSIHNFRIWTITSAPNDYRTAAKRGLGTMFPFGDGSGGRLPEETGRGRARIYKLQHQQPSANNPMIQVALSSMSQSAMGYVTVICGSRQNTFELRVSNLTPPISLGDCGLSYLVYSPHLDPGLSSLPISVALRSSAASSSPPPSGSKIQIRAYGDAGGERMELRVSGQTVKSWYVSSSAQTYTYNHGSRVNANQISVHFTNNGRAPSTGADLNLIVDKMILNGITYQTEAATVQGKGHWNGTSCGHVAYHRSEKLHCNGYFNYRME